MAKLGSSSFARTPGASGLISMQSFYLRCAIWQRSFSNADLSVVVIVVVVVVGVGVGGVNFKGGGGGGLISETHR